MKHQHLINSLAILFLGAAVLALVFAHGNTASQLNQRINETNQDIYDVAVNYEEQLAYLGASLAISSPVPLFEDALASRIDGDDTSFTLISGLDKTDTLLASSTYGFILSEGSANEEFVLADCTGTACTRAVRGYWPLTGATSSALQKTHRRGDVVKITDSPIINELKRVVNGEDTVPNLLAYTSGTVCTAGSDDQTLCHKGYMDNLSIQGSPTSTESVIGLVTLATPQQQASGTYIGVNDPLVLQTRYATDTPTVGCATGYGSVPGAGCVVVGNLLGKIAHSLLDLTQNFNFTGTVGVGTTTPSANLASHNGAYIGGTTTIANLRMASSTLQIGDDFYILPSEDGTDGQHLTTNGSGTLSFASSTLTNLLTASGTPTTIAGGTHGTNETVIATTTIPANTLGTNGAVRLRAIGMRMIWDNAAGSQTHTLRVRANGTSLGSCSVTNSSVDLDGGFFEMTWIADGSTSAQLTDILAMFVSDDAVNDQDSCIHSDSSSIDTTAEVVITLTGTLGSSHGGNQIAAGSVILEDFNSGL